MSSRSSPATSGDQTIIIILAVYVLLVLRRVYRSLHGMRFSEGGTLGALLLYVAIGSLASIPSFFEGVSILFAPLYLALLVGSALWSHKYADSRIAFWSGADGQVYFKGGVILYLIYVVGFIGRVAIGFVFIGPNFLTSYTTIQPLASTGLYATIATDLLLMFGLGLLIGRNVRVLRRGRLIKEGKETLPDSPPPIKPLFGSRKDEASSQP